MSGSCSVVRAPAAVDAAGRRAWVMFSCAPAGGSYTSYVAELALGQPGDAPALAGVCTARSLNAITPLFYSAAVNKSAPWYVGPLAPFSRAFYTLAVPTGLSTNVGITPPLCTLTNIGELRAAPLVPTQSMYMVDDVPPADGSSGGAAAAMLYAVSSSDFGIRLIGISVPGGTSTLDITLPCDTGVCVGSAVSFAGVRGGAVTVGGNAPYFADWSSATLAQSLQLTSAGTNATPPTTFIGRLSRAAPSSFPLVLPATVALLPNPGSTEADADITWLQSLSWGSVACTSASSRAQLRSIAMLSSAAPDFALVTNTSVPACPLPEGQQCYALGIAYVEAFAAVAA
ncbi:MAG: hypothetical protein EOO41_03680 [Methanobacteriota archaeon]|nr:MAG: hypothetical protein EOO41_03680 [Euryarchaeota archaeon]